ncbi:hypothetical protein PRVXH_001042 [Proteinivorax hydrogeniformans]|uniref:Transposase n=1 Tax=Proteinivorax hydrogeniformans TaxID=1826727 RepID=A0AAU8HWD9_9FIRM
MSKKEIVVGVDVGKDFSYFHIEDPNSGQVGKAFKVMHTHEGLISASKKIKEVEARLKSDSTLIIEDTGQG